MKSAVEMGSDAMIYITKFYIEIGSEAFRSYWGRINIHTDSKTKS
jgi:hypothetical protein